MSAKGLDKRSASQNYQLETIQRGKCVCEKSQKSKMKTRPNHKFTSQGKERPARPDSLFATIDPFLWRKCSDNLEELLKKLASVLPRGAHLTTSIATMLSQVNGKGFRAADGKDLGSIL